LNIFGKIKTIGPSEYFLNQGDIGRLIIKVDAISNDQTFTSQFIKIQEQSLFAPK
jgi:hypothetical protein